MATGGRGREPRALEIYRKSTKSHEIPINTSKSMKMQESYEISWNHRKSINIDETAASWNRVKVSLRASSRWQRAAEAANLGLWNPWKIYEIVWNPQKYIKITENAWNLWNLMKSSEIDQHRWNSSQLESRRGFFMDRTHRALESWTRRQRR